MELAVADIDDCFHRYRMPVEMGAYFCLQPLPPKYPPAGRGRSLTRKEALTTIWPALASLPMGFAWSVYLAQRAAETLVRSMPLCPPPALIHDRSRLVVLTPGCPPRHFVYVDNIGVVSAEKGQATEAMDGVRQVMDGQKRKMHERGLLDELGGRDRLKEDAGAAHREETVET